tara:strand:+ start:35 stop:253 length:219 start_codon:yes stop_codon:yes gene_type:complete
MKNKNGTLHSSIIDEEGDKIKVRFGHDYCVHVKTKGYTFLTLSIENLYQLINMIEDAEYFYRQENEKEDQNN